MLGSSYVPYCGTPPTPADWLLRWNFDPWLLAILGAVAVAYEIALRRATLRGVRAAKDYRRAAFRTGWAILTLGLVSPLCALSVAMFSARVTQHIVLLFVAAPLVMYARPLDLVSGLRENRVRLGSVAGGTISALLLTALFWLWHAPRFYDATFTSTTTYWAMHISMLGGAALFWHAIMGSTSGGGDLVRLSRPLLIAGVFTQMGLLGALLTLAPRLIYSPHVSTTLPFGFTALEDQQLGGLIMWVPGGLSLLLIGLALARSLTLDETPAGGVRP